MSQKAPKVSIIVPAYREAKNLDPLTRRVFAALQKANLKNSTELIVVDDNSPDDSVEVVNKLSKEGFPVRIIVRKTERGLSSAVLRGFDEAKGEILLCMDADLQHPPEKVPELIEKLSNKNGTEYILGTRYGKGVAIDKDWPLHRRIISSGARLLARPLTPLSDPMSGFFGLTSTAYQRGKQNGINSRGFKLALELYVKSHIKKRDEVPFSFGVRVAGESKLTGKVMVDYLLHLRELYSYRYPYLLPILILLFLLLFVLVISKLF